MCSSRPRTDGEWASDAVVLAPVWCGSRAVVSVSNEEKACPRFVRREGLGGASDEFTGVC